MPNHHPLYTAPPRLTADVQHSSHLEAITADQSGEYEPPSPTLFDYLRIGLLWLACAAAILWQDVRSALSSVAPMPVGAARLDAARAAKMFLAFLLAFVLGMSVVAGVWMCLCLVMIGGAA